MYKCRNPLNLIKIVEFPEYFDLPNFFPFNMITYDSNKFANYDSPELFSTNQQKKSKFWHYNSKEIVYNVNSNGYRTKDWKDIDWKESIVIFGCSNTVGIGLAEDETISSQLSLLCQRPVINMGVPASSIEFSFYNSVILSECYPTPYAVVQLWTTIDRCIHFQDLHAENCGIWKPDNSYFKEFIKNEFHPVMQAKFISLASKNLWKDRCKYYSASFFDHTSYYLECDYIKSDNQARDDLHPGRNSAKQMAFLIYENLFLKE